MNEIGRYDNSLIWQWQIKCKKVENDTTTMCKI